MKPTMQPMHAIVATAFICLTGLAVPAGAEEQIPRDCGLRSVGDYVYYVNFPSATFVSFSTWNVHDTHYNAYGTFIGGYQELHDGVQYYAFQIQSGFSSSSDWCIA